MKASTKKIVKNVLGVCLFLGFCYLMIVLNLHKSTKTFEFNIFKFTALKEFLVFSAVVLPVIIIARLIFKRYPRKNKTDEKT